MAVIKSSIPYAKAFFDLAKDKNMMADFKSDIQMIWTSLNSSKELTDIISNPTINKASKVEILTKLFSGKIKSETSGFLNLMIQKGRIGQLGSICESFIDMINKESNIVLVKLTTATQVSDDIQSQIASKVLSNSKFEIESIVNPAIIGGYILEFDNKMIDHSISNKIQKIKNNLV